MNPWTDPDSPIKLLFNYGSNGVEQLRERTGADVTPYKAILKHHVRIFAGYDENWRGGVASIRPCRGKKVQSSSNDSIGTRPAIDAFESVCVHLSRESDGRAFGASFM